MNIIFETEPLYCIPVIYITLYLNYIVLIFKRKAVILFSFEQILNKIFTFQMFRYASYS